VAEDRHVRIVDRAQQTIGRLLRFLGQRGVWAGDDDVEFREQVVVVIE